MLYHIVKLILSRNLNAFNRNPIYYSDCCFLLSRYVPRLHIPWVLRHHLLGWTSRYCSRPILSNLFEQLLWRLGVQKVFSGRKHGIRDRNPWFLKFHGTNKITSLKRKIIWTKPPFLGFKSLIFHGAFVPNSPIDRWRYYVQICELLKERHLFEVNPGVHLYTDDFVFWFPWWMQLSLWESWGTEFTSWLV